jgi:uncharacterized damage-inducible protein DinB
MRLVELIAHIIERELDGLRKQLQAYPDEKDIWAAPHGIKNSAGTLALHLIGNLRHFIGAYLGESGYIRDREAEFSTRDTPRAELLDQIDQTIQEVKSALSDLKEEELNRIYPLEIGGVRVQSKDWLLHLMGHLSYHLGQIDYHRRFVTGDSSGAGMLAVHRLKTAITSTNAG